MTQNSTRFQTIEISDDLMTPPLLEIQQVGRRQALLAVTTFEELLELYEAAGAALNRYYAEEQAANATKYLPVVL